ncbi:MAG: hypothetical protein ACFFBD_30010 [Candidatus Hodarchaeota archaeon]
MKKKNFNFLGFLFDIDGCLTLPMENNLDRSILDIELLDRIHALHLQQVPITFVTGRSVGYLKKYYEQHERLKYQEIPHYLEFGLVNWLNGKIKVLETAKPFIKVKKRLLAALHHYCIDHNIFFEPDQSYDDYPDHGGMWLENKIIQLSIASGKNITPVKVHDITLAAWKQFSTLGRFLPHHLGIDVIPRGWSKAKATEHFILTLNRNESDYQWYVLGDNESDREMTSGLTQVTFINTQKAASRMVWELLESLKIL